MARFTGDFTVYNSGPKFMLEFIAYFHKVTEEAIWTQKCNCSDLSVIANASLQLPPYFEGHYGKVKIFSKDKMPSDSEGHQLSFIVINMASESGKKAWNTIWYGDEDGGRVN